MTVTMLAAVARNGVIGRDGRMPWHLREDLEHFKHVTMGHVLVMGRRTYESVGRPLPGRTTVVVTRDGDWSPPGGRPDGVVVATSLSSALRVAGEIDQQVYVVGGGQVYAESIASVDELLISWVDAEPEGDTFFPDVAWDDWTAVSRDPYDGWQLTRYVRASISKGYKEQHVDAV